MGFLSLIIKRHFFICCNMANSRNEDIKKKRMTEIDFVNSRSLCTLALLLYNCIPSTTHTSPIHLLYVPPTDSTFNHVTTDLIQ